MEETPPKEKAQELINKFIPYVEWMKGVEKWAIRNAIYSSIILVNEILNSKPLSPVTSAVGSTWENIHNSERYWKCVKNELENELEMLLKTLG